MLQRATSVRTLLIVRMSCISNYYSSNYGISIKSSQLDSGILRELTCNDVHQDPSSLVDLQPDLCLTQIQPGAPGLLLEVKGQEKASLVPRPEL